MAVNGIKNINCAGIDEHDPTPSRKTTRPLNVVIVGAGIGGLTAAVGLRRSGHNVALYEQSQFANEIGAAVHIAPNANGVLRQLGIVPDTFGAVEMRHVLEYGEKGEVLMKVPLEGSSKLWQHPWQLVHRARLHEALKKTAVSLGATLHTSSKVLQVSPGTATLMLSGGRQVKADLVVGADGIYSITRTAVSGHESKLFSSGKAAFRFLVPRSVVEMDPVTAPLIATPNALAMWFGSDRRIVMYPCNDNELLNFVCIHPEAESQGSKEGMIPPAMSRIIHEAKSENTLIYIEWNKQGSLDQLLEVYKNFSPAVVKLLAKAPAESLKVWKLIDMEILPTWVKGRLCLLGDAAHPFLPHQGQGAAVAMEDAAALATVFPGGTPDDEVMERLKLYENIRYERANAIQEFSRKAGLDWTDGKPQVDIQKYTIYNFGHDEWHHSQKALKDWQKARNPSVYWRMPLAFGPAPGPRQDAFGNPHVSEHQTFSTASIKFRTSRTFLQNLFPTTSFTFKSPGTVAFASFSVTTLDKMAWLGGSGYNHFGLYIHGVQYKKRDGVTVDGTYIPILFENLADPIITGRDEVGMPKMYCEIDIERSPKTLNMLAAWRGVRFASIDIADLHVAEKGTHATDGEQENELVYKYIPAVGEKGKSDCEYAVVIPHSEEVRGVPSTIRSVMTTKKASISFHKVDRETLPTLYDVVETLSEIPIYEVLGGKVVEGLGVRDLSSARRIE